MTDLNDPSGSGAYVRGYWGSKAFWQNVPPQWRTLDSGDDYLQRLLNQFGDTGEEILGAIQALPLQRDPYLVRTVDSEVEWFYVKQAIVENSEFFGKVTRLIGEPNPSLIPNGEDDPPTTDADVLARWYPWFPYSEISKVGPDWEVVIGGGRFTVANVRSRNFDKVGLYNPDTSIANEVWVSGGDFQLRFDCKTNTEYAESLNNPNESAYRVIGVTDGSRSPIVMLPMAPLRLVRRDIIIGGVGDLSDATLSMRVPMLSGDVILADVPATAPMGNLCAVTGSVIDTGDIQGTVNYDTGEILLNLKAATYMVDGFGYPGVEDIELEPYKIYAKWVVEGYCFKMNAPPMIDYLAKDYAFDNDQNDPVPVQRSAVANVTKFFGLKCSAESYRIRGAISLFDVNMMGLFRLGNGMTDESVAAMVPASNRFSIDGYWYTDLYPRFLRFDDIRADEEVYDADPAGAQWWPLVDNMFIGADPGAWDGMTKGQKYAVDVAQGFYGMVSPLVPYNATRRAPCEVVSSTALSYDDLKKYSLAKGYKVVVSMMRCQYDAFNFHKGKFAFSKYTSIVAPKPSDALIWIDAVEVPWENTDPPTPVDVSNWTVICGIGIDGGNPFTAGDYVAIQYVPEDDSTNCSYCRSFKMRCEIVPKPEAYTFYDTVAKMDSAIVRLKKKLEVLRMITERIAQYDIERVYTYEMTGVVAGQVWLDLGSDIKEGAYHIGVRAYVRGDFVSAGSSVQLGFYQNKFSDPLEQGEDPPLWGPFFDAGWTDPTVWHEVVTDWPIDLIVDKEISPMITAIAASSPGNTVGSVRWELTVRKRES